jgi:hypothetical protein
MIAARTPSSNLPQMVDTGLPDTRYAEVLTDIKARVDAARVRALRAANAELMSVYWHIGRHIAEQEDSAPIKRGPNAPKIVGGPLLRLPRHDWVLTAEPALHARLLPRLDRGGNYADLGVMPICLPISVLGVVIAA